MPWFGDVATLKFERGWLGIVRIRKTTAVLPVLLCLAIHFLSCKSRVKTWNLATGTVVETLFPQIERHEDVKTLDNTRIISKFGGKFKVWNLQTGQIEQAHSLTEYWADLQLPPAGLRGALVVYASNDCKLKVWNTETEQIAQVIPSHAVWGCGLATLSDQRVIYASNGTLKVWNPQTEQVEQTLNGHESTIYKVEILDTQRIVSASTDGMVKVWNLKTGWVEQKFIINSGWYVRPIKVVTGQHIISVDDDDYTLKIWNIERGTLEQTLVGHQGLISDVTVIDGQRIVSAGRDDTLKVWNLTTGQLIASIGLDGAPHCVAVTRQDGRTLVVAGDTDGALYCLELVEPVAS